MREKIKHYEEVEKRSREALVALSDGKNAKGHGIRLTQHVRKGTVEYAKIPELQGLDLEKYRKVATSYWKILEEKSLCFNHQKSRTLKID